MFQDDILKCLVLSTTSYYYCILTRKYSHLRSFKKPFYPKLKTLFSGDSRASFQFICGVLKECDKHKMENSSMKLLRSGMGDWWPSSSLTVARTSIPKYQISINSWFHRSWRPASNLPTFKPDRSINKCINANIKTTNIDTINFDSGIYFIRFIELVADMSK